MASCASSQASAICAGVAFFCSANEPNRSTRAWFALRFSGAESRHAVAEIGAVELRIGIDLAGQKTFAERAERNESDAQFFQCRHHRFFRLSPEQGVLTLQRRHRLHRMGAADRLCARFREAEVLDLALLNQFLHRARNVFDRHVQVDAMLIEKIDGIDSSAA